MGIRSNRVITAAHAPDARCDMCGDIEREWDVDPLWRVGGIHIHKACVRWLAKVQYLPSKPAGSRTNRWEEAWGDAAVKEAFIDPLTAVKEAS